MRKIKTDHSEQKKKLLLSPEITFAGAVVFHPVPLGSDSDSLIIGRLRLVLLLSEVLLHTLFLKLIQTLQFLRTQS